MQLGCIAFHSSPLLRVEDIDRMRPAMQEMSAGLHCNAVRNGLGGARSMCVQHACRQQFSKQLRK